MYFMSDAPVDVSWQLPDYSIIGIFLYLIMYFQQFKWFLINLLLATFILWFAFLYQIPSLDPQKHSTAFSSLFGVSLVLVT